MERKGERKLYLMKYARASTSRYLCRRENTSDKLLLLAGNEFNCFPRFPRRAQSFSVRMKQNIVNNSQWTQPSPIHNSILTKFRSRKNRSTNNLARPEKRWTKQKTKLFMLLNCIIFPFQSALVALSVPRGNDSFNAILMLILMIIIVCYQVSCDETSFLIRPTDFKCLEFLFSELKSCLSEFFNVHLR